MRDNAVSAQLNAELRHVLQEGVVAWAVRRLLDGVTVDRAIGISLGDERREAQ